MNTCTHCGVEKAKSHMATSTICKSCKALGSPSADDEVEALRLAYFSLLKLPPDAQCRAVRYLAERFNVGAIA